MFRPRLTVAILVFLLLIVAGGAYFFLREKPSAPALEKAATCKPTTGTPASKVFGIVQGFFPWSANPKDLDYMKELSVKWARLELRWDYIEPQKGRFNWEFYDTVIKSFDENNIKVLGQLQATPSWANGGKEDAWYPPLDLNDWANFVKKAAERYKPGGTLGLKTGITHWEIWNEPNTTVFWRPSPDADAYQRAINYLLSKGYTQTQIDTFLPQIISGEIPIESLPPQVQKDIKEAYNIYKNYIGLGYTNLLAVSNKAIREVDPKAIIVGMAEAGVEPTFVDSIYKLGAKNCFDVISFHPYGPAQELKPRTEAIKKFLVDHNDANKPIWYTEFGFETGFGKGTTEAQQAEYLKQTYDLFSQGLVPAIFWIGLRDEDPSADFTWGILRSDFSKKPAFDVLKNLLNPSTGIQINVDAAKSIGRISSHFFGTGHENNSDFVIPRNLKLQTIRYRAGCDVEEFYHWRDYVGPVVQRYNYMCYGNNPGGVLTGPFTYPNPARTNYYIESLDDALTYLKQKGIKVILGVNFGTGSAQEAANYVEYINGISPGLMYGMFHGWKPDSYKGDEKAPQGYFAWLREYFGYKNPYNVRYWSIGNEWYGQTSGMSWTGNAEKYFHGGTDRPKSFTGAAFGPFKLEGKLPMTRKADRMDWSWPMKISDGTPNQSFYGPFMPAVRGTQTIYVTEVTSYNPEGALNAAIDAFKQYLSGKGYSSSFIDTALIYVGKYIENKKNEVDRYLSTLTYQQHQDIIAAFKAATEVYDRTYVTIGKTETWQEVPDITKAGKGEYYQFFPEDARVLFGDGTHGDIPPKFSIITTNYDTGPHNGFLQYAQKMKAVDPNINIGVVIDSLNMEGVVIPQDVRPYVGYIAANMYYSPYSPQVAQAYGLEEGYYSLVTRPLLAGDAIKNARVFMERYYGGANKWPIFNTEWADLALDTNRILAHSIFAADMFRTQAQNGVDISIIWALPGLNPNAYFFRAPAPAPAPAPAYDYLTPDGLIVNLYQEHFGKNLIEAVTNQELFDYYREAGKPAEAEQRFKNFLLSKGYSAGFINRAWEIAVIVRSNGVDDPRVTAYLNSLTSQQKDDVLLAYSTVSIMPFNLIETLASKSDDGKIVYVLVINKHYKDAKSVTINLKNLSGSSASIKADTYLLTSGSILDENTPSDPRKVKVQKSSKTFAGDSFLYDAPPHSIAFIEFYRQ